MTIEQYFKKEQPINNATLKDTCLYKNVSVIDFTVTDEQYATIKIARIDKDIWALGYEIKPHESMPIISKDCTTHAVTKGCINNLVYGMTKVLLLHLKRVQCTMPLVQAIRNGMKEASEYCYKPIKPIGKITI